MNPDVICSVKKPPFRKGSFETVICDPPFSLYNKFKWVHNLALLCKKRVILSHPLFNINLKKGFRRQLYATDIGGFFLRLWSIHDKTELANYA